MQLGVWEVLWAPPPPAGPEQNTAGVREPKQTLGYFVLKRSLWMLFLGPFPRTKTPAQSGLSFTILINYFSCTEYLIWENFVREKWRNFGQMT